jgi:hypothetical protein
LFTYFETKADLLNQLYIGLKAEMASVAMSGFPEKAKLRDQAYHIWANWMRWAVGAPEKRRALAQLTVSEEITPTSCAQGHKSMANVAELMERIRTNGPMRDAPLRFVFAIMNSLAETTMDFMVQDPSNSDKHCKAGFDAFWRVIA